ncbi:MAG: Modification methylase BslI [Candidatus Nomurabacteria bacterium GW2011_GWF2_35_12]|uniref:Methyltransferase n=3 Tax=Candidatus Nomuraibacteriota TaxID=1752729 RepID=A0A0G0H0P1_9BACT|nr:MAG: Modification methylase BslI [Candidatus Nomurabacteria bacterium GW2011_GWF2_35_12]KKP72669.1 MAG: Modification methylase BslI [Candidatus Nomurabacteria bacterium GW2011_GWB1_35_20]KKP76477.1 MAG: Modification methylase BslI [Parcubacteria group bacterium GW2011_GWC1_35_21]KKP78173.1 MAG: Modification methylase BslI [Candidatus Nomurabacteria bacterium GW2011_GWC2_35_35]KKP88302.1 MAG: Modification methylase BslI [Candidatus Nomurabacteria bacterium GW2011_GWA2_35_80]KKP97532.1 MAG: M
MSKNYLKKILNISEPYLKKSFSKGRLEEFFDAINFIYNFKKREDIVKNFSDKYIEFIKEDYQRQYQGTNEKLNNFLEKKDDGVKIVWGDCYNTMKAMKSESIHCMVTSPPYYNARDYSNWKNMDDYFRDMQNIIKEAYRVLDNHRVFVFNVGDVFDNDNLKTESVWGKRRLPLGAYFIKIFEEEGFTFVDDFIWDKGEVQSERHKNGDKPYPFYQYPANCYEHILIFHKHRLDETRYPCPVCGTLKVNGNTQSEIGLRSWECKNFECFERSKSNRGKRFSLKTLTTQSHQEKEYGIPEEFIKKWRRDIIKFSPVIKINSKGENTLGHTAPFPENIPEFAVRMYSYKGEKVLDPFGGSFTSIIIAKKLDRIGIGIELNKRMFREASLKNIKKNLLTLFDKKDIKISEYDHEKQ